MLSAAAVAEHDAVRVYRTVCPEGASPVSVEVLKKTGASAAYRLHGAGVIAKRTNPVTASVERRVYQEVLPKLPMPSLRCYGYLKESEEYSWLILEDSGGLECSFGKEEPILRKSASQWLAQLHVWAAKLDPVPELPLRDSAYYLAQLRETRTTIIDNIGNPWLDASDRRVLETLVKQCENLISDWSSIDSECANAPATLVHGDFRPRNVHRRGSVLFVLDWEYSGWGLPAADLPMADLASYGASASSLWPRPERLAALGSLFQTVCAIGWSAAYLPFESAAKGMKHLRCYPAALTEALRGLETM